ncbi:hypothetical protein [Celeribacter litoreus]|uniref:hypothetical protein n=1 Tax=Celeribacter litoreus TaxID=2876714 RepID=UPI001CC914E0|nr:hypothetical protein [Celeribacter litoreus]MCA0042127.1 hypothetical protein [Celeribacter litoreus]
MTGFNLFKNAILRVLHHLDEALAVSGLIWIAILIGQILVFGSMDMEAISSGDPEAAAQIPVLPILLLNVATAVGSCWIAVEWHRFVLEGRRPRSAFPQWSGGRVWSYFFASILMGLLIALFIGFCVGLILALFGASVATSGGGLFVLILLLLPALFIFFRLSPVLPSIAMQNQMSFAKAWQATKPHSVVIFQATILSIGALMVIQMIAPIFGAGILGLLYELVAGWAVLMVNVSLLSSIYEISVRRQFSE